MLRFSQVSFNSLFISNDSMRREHFEQLYLPLGEGTLRNGIKQASEPHTARCSGPACRGDCPLLASWVITGFFLPENNSLHHFSRQGRGCSPKNKRQGRAGGLASGAQQGLPALSSMRVAEGLILAGDRLRAAPCLPAALLCWARTKR